MNKFSPQNDDSPAAKLWDSWNFPMSAGFWQAGEAYTKACADWQQELTRFTSARLEECRELQQALAKCRTMGDVAKLQQEWAMVAARAYITEATRLAGIFAKLVQPEK